MRLALLALLLQLGGCIIPFMTPPLKGEIGGATRIGRATKLDEMETRTGNSALHAAVGTHIASASLHGRDRFDIGAGWTMEKLKDATSNGAYLDTSYFIDRGGNARTSLGMRGEFRSLDHGYGGAAKLRIDTELFTSGTDTFDGSDHCGTATGTHYGTTAIGVFVEAGRAWAGDMDGGDAWVATAGISVRMPMTAGVWIGNPWCK